MAQRYRRSPSAATRFKMSLAKQGSKNPMYGKHHSRFTREKISKKMKDYWRQIYEEAEKYI